MARFDLEYDWNLNSYVDLAATERNVYILAKNKYWNDPNFSSTSFRFAFIVFHRTCSATDPMSFSQIHSSYWWIDCPFERLLASAGEAKNVVATMLASNPQFPFYVFNRRSRQSLFWKEFPADDDGSSSSALELVPLERLDDMITRISEAAARIAREASESGCNVAKMLIEIDKRTVIPHHKFEVVRILTHNYDNDDDGDADRDRDRDGDEDEPELNSAIEESFAESPMAFGSVPAAESVVEALEKFRYEGSCDQDHEDESKLIEACVICMEEVMIGSNLTRMPCSHVFHEDCISHWLHQTRTCPICRFKLPS